MLLDPLRESDRAIDEHFPLPIDGDDMVTVVEHQHFDEPAQVLLEIEGVLQARKVILARMGDEDGDAVSHTYGERDPLFRSNVPICFISPEPTLPPTSVHEHTGAVNLADRREASSGFRQFALHGRPPSHDFVDGIGAGQPERPRITGRSEGTNPPLLEIGDSFLRNFTHATDGDRRRG